MLSKRLFISLKLILRRLICFSNLVLNCFIFISIIAFRYYIYLVIKDVAIVISINLVKESIIDSYSSDLIGLASAGLKRGLNVKTYRGLGIL